MKWFGKRAAGSGRKTRANVAAIDQLDQELQGARSPVDRTADGVTRFAGRPAFLLVHAALLAAWAVLNSGLVLGPDAFDAYPYLLLNFVLAADMVLLSGLILMSQNRQQALDRRRLRLGLQVDLLAEQEATKALQLLGSICDRLGVRQAAADEELKEVIGTTHVEALARALEAERTAGDAPPRCFSNLGPGRERPRREGS